MERWKKKRQHKQKWQLAEIIQLMHLASLKNIDSRRFILFAFIRFWMVHTVCFYTFSPRFGSLSNSFINICAFACISTLVKKYCHSMICNFVLGRTCLSLLLGIALILLHDLLWLTSPALSSKIVPPVECWKLYANSDQSEFTSDHKAFDRNLKWWKGLHIWIHSCRWEFCWHLSTYMKEIVLLSLLVEIKTTFLCWAVISVSFGLLKWESRRCESSS